jgi:hypothetical protein
MSSIPKSKCILCNKCILCYKPINTVLHPWSWVKNHRSLQCIPTPYQPLQCMSHNCNIPKTLVDCSGCGTLSFMSLNTDMQTLHVLVRIMIMIFHSCQVRMLGQMTMLRGHKVLKKSGVQLKVGSKNGMSSTIWSWDMTKYDLSRVQIKNTRWYFVGECGRWW